MTCAIPRLLFAVLAGVVALFATAPAEAFCRRTTTSNNAESFDPAAIGRCDDAPNALPLYWAQSCVEYRVVVDPELETQGKMTQARAAEITHRAFESWSTAQCSSTRGEARPPAIQLVDVAQSRCPGARWSGHNEVRFTAQPSDGDGLAVTDLAFDPATGGVMTAVTRVFDDYAHLGASQAEVDASVAYIVRHELGHFLGLAHSEHEDAVMNASFRTSTTEALSEDDMRGICEAYGPDAPIGAGCAVALARPRSALACVALLAVLTCLFARRRRKIPLLLVLAFSLAPASALAASKKPPAKIAPAKPRKPKSPAPTPPPPPVAVPTTTPIPSPSPSPSPSASASASTSAAAPDVADRRPSTSEVYLGGSYRAFLLPRAFLGALGGRANKDPVFHAASVQATFRSASGFSVIPALSFADLSTGDMLVSARANELASSFSYIRSDLKGAAASVELVWSLPLSSRVGLELGLELGLAATFGKFVNNWVYETPDGPLSYGGRRFAPCKTVNDGVGCRPQDHASPSPAHVGDYAEPSMFAGGAAPTLLPWMSLPLVGVRARVADDVALRFGLGASFTGFWAGASLDYAVARSTK